MTRAAERPLLILAALYLIAVCLTPRTLVMRLGFVILLLLGSVAYAFGGELPDARKTPGLADPALTKEVICKKGWSTKSVRHVTASLKRKVYRVYHLKGNHTGYCAGKQGCEIDHLVALEIGGANDIKNLWPQSFDTAPYSAHTKDLLENKLHKLVCAGTITLEEAQAALRGNWIAAFKKYIGDVE